MTSLEWLQQWYFRQCNDTWEHHHGINIQSLDNPGWLVKINLAGTPLASLAMPEIGDVSLVNHRGTSGDHNWINCKVENGVFTGAGGPFPLMQICAVFEDWVK